MPKKEQTKVIMHNSVSLDGSFIHLELTPELMGLHYEVAASFGPTIRLFGSNTAKVSIEMFGGFEAETAGDFQKQEKPVGPDYWVVIDSKAALMGKLHYFRRSEYCRDVAVLVSSTTPAEYLDYLKVRDYDHFISGENRVDLRCGLVWMVSRYGTNTIMVDSGSGLTNAMLNQGLVDQISLLVLPAVVGNNGENLFGKVARPLQLSLVKQQAYPGGYVWSLYEVAGR